MYNLGKKEVLEAKDKLERVTDGHRRVGFSLIRPSESEKTATVFLSNKFLFV